MTHLTCRLTAKNRDQLRNPTLGNRISATFSLPFLPFLGNSSDNQLVKIPGAESDYTAFVACVLQYGSVEALLRIVSHVDAEMQSMVRVSPAEYSRYRYPVADLS